MYIYNLQTRQHSSFQNKPTSSSLSPSSLSNIKRPFAPLDGNTQTPVMGTPSRYMNNIKRSFSEISNSQSPSNDIKQKKVKEFDFPLPAEPNKADNGFESSQVRIAHALAIDPSKRVLCFNPSAPFPMANIEVNAYQPKLNTHALDKNRRILSIPEKVLDAPYLSDDYYHNILDWSSTNIVAVALHKSVYLWDANSGTINPIQYNEAEKIASLNWSSDGTYLAIGTVTGDTQIWDVEANKKLRSMKGQNCRIGVLGWKKHVVSSGAQDGSILCHDVRMEDHVVRKLYGHSGEVVGLKWQPDNDLLATGGNDNTVNIWDARSTTPKFEFRSHLGAVKALAWCPWSTDLLASGGGRDDRTINFWDAKSGRRMNSVRTNSQVTSLSWSQHYREIASTHGYPYNQISIWNYATTKKIIDIPAHDSRILSSAMSPDGQILATAAADQNLKFWRIFDATNQPRLDPEHIIHEKKQYHRKVIHSLR